MLPSNLNVYGVIRGGVLVQVSNDGGASSFQKWRWYRWWTLLGCKHQRLLLTSVSSPKTPLGHSDIGLHDVFDDPPLQFSSQITWWMYGTIRVERRWWWNFSLLSVDWSQWELGAWGDFNGAAELEPSSHPIVRLSWNLSMMRLPFFSLSNTYLSFLPSPVRLFRNCSQWCGCLSHLQKKWSCSSLRGRGSVLVFQWCGYTLHFSTDRKNQPLSDHLSLFSPLVQLSILFFNGALSFLFFLSALSPFFFLLS